MASSSKGWSFYQILQIVYALILLLKAVFMMLCLVRDVDSVEWLWFLVEAVAVVAGFYSVFKEHWWCSVAFVVLYTITLIADEYTYMGCDWEWVLYLPVSVTYCYLLAK